MIEIIDSNKFDEPSWRPRLTRLAERRGILLPVIIGDLAAGFCDRGHRLAARIRALAYHPSEPGPDL